MKYDILFKQDRWSALKVSPKWSSHLGHGNDFREIIQNIQQSHKIKYKETVNKYTKIQFKIN